MSTLARMFPGWTRRGIAIRRALGRPVLTDPGMIWQHYAARHPDVFFVQIGANNGDHADHLAAWIDRRPRWRGVLVEPLPEPFSALQRRRGDPVRFRLVQAAVVDHDGTVDLHVVESGSVMELQLSSLYRDVIAKSGVPEDRLVTVTVPAVTLATLLDGTQRVDAFHIDTEGHDAAIIDQMDLDRLRPDVVMFEARHLSAVDYQRCEERFRSAGYRVVRNECDAIAIHAESRSPSTGH